MPLAEATPYAEVPAVDFTLSGAQCPITKGTLKIMAQKDETTGSTSVGPDGKVWSDYGEGKSGWSFNIEAVWRRGANVLPPDVRRGATYPCKIWWRRAGFNSGSDPGSYYFGNLFIDDWELTFDPSAGKYEWKLTGTGNGPIQGPT
jgi:hypothetical protein